MLYHDQPCAIYCTDLVAFVKPRIDAFDLFRELGILEVVYRLTRLDDDSACNSRVRKKPSEHVLAGVEHRAARSPRNAPPHTLEITCGAEMV